MRRPVLYLVSLLVSLGATAAACGGSDAGGPGVFDNNGNDGGTGGGDGSGGNNNNNDSGGFGNSDSGGQVNDGAGFDGPTCAATNVDAKRAIANILFIIDRSGSMSCNPPPTTSSATCEQFPTTANPGQPTKWTITRDALKGAVAQMPGTNHVGLTYFNTNDECGVRDNPNVAITPVAPAHVTAVNASLDAVAPKGLTPVVGGVTLGYHHLHTGSFQGRKFLVLITDGAETCAPLQVDDFVNKTVKDALSVGIRTFVIGAPGSEPARRMLSQIAKNGGTARTPGCNASGATPDVGDCHFDLTNASTNLATELNAALDSISREALGCEFDVPAATDAGTIDYNKVNVTFTPSTGPAQQLVQDSRDCGGAANGWQYTPDRSKIILCGQACTNVKNDQGGKVTIQLGCGTIIR